MQDLAVREEAKRVEEVMEQIANAQVEQEQKDGEERLRISLQKQREEFDIEKSKAIQECRQEEEDKASDTLTELMKKHEETILRIKQEAEKIKQV